MKPRRPSVQCLGGKDGCYICGEKPKYYRCTKCRRKVPWCFGAADDKPGRCDDCWAEAHHGDDQNQSRAA